MTKTTRIQGFPKPRFTKTLSFAKKDLWKPLTQTHLQMRSLGDRLLSSAGAGENCARPMRLPDPSPVLDKNRAPMGPEILPSTGAGLWRKAPMAFPDSSSVLDKFQSASSLA